MDNETTMPGLLTLPGTLDEKARPAARRFLFYKFIFGAAVLVLAMGFLLL